MKTLVIIRHAKSSWDNPSMGDFDRPLNERGKYDAPRMGKRLKEKDLNPDLLLSSPAKRALTTCKIIADAIHYPAEKIKTDENLYHASDDEILSILQGLENHFNTVIIFGHNPGLTDFVNNLTKSRIDNVPTCGIIACSLDVENWSEVEWGLGKVLFFDFPKKYD